MGNKKTVQIADIQKKLQQLSSLRDSVCGEIKELTEKKQTLEAQIHILDELLAGVSPPRKAPPRGAGQRGASRKKAGKGAPKKKAEKLSAKQQSIADKVLEAMKKNGKIERWTTDEIAEAAGVDAAPPLYKTLKKLRDMKNAPLEGELTKVEGRKNEVWVYSLRPSAGGQPSTG